MILIIDSEKQSDIKIKHTFEDMGLISVELIRTAKEAKQFVSESSENINLIIIDSELEDGSGYDLCKEFRKIDSLRNAHIIVLVSSGENKTAIEKAKYCGASDYSVKPYHAAEFQRHIIPFMISRSVLLVEDDPLIRQMVRKIFSKYPVELIEIDDGVKAYNKINSMLPVRLVLLDIGLPNMNGIQIISQLKNKASWKKSAVVMLTGSKDASDVKNSLAAGAKDYIVKPFNVKDFIERLSRYLPDGN